MYCKRHTGVRSKIWQSGLNTEYCSEQRGVLNILLLERFRATFALKMDWFDINYNIRVCKSQRSNRAWLFLHLWVHSHCTRGNWDTYFPSVETLLFQRGFCEGAQWPWHRQNMGSCNHLRLWAQHGRVALMAGEDKERGDCSKMTVTVVTSDEYSYMVDKTWLH